MAITGQISFGTFENMSSIVFDGTDATYEIGQVYYGLNLIWKNEPTPVTDLWKSYTLGGTNISLVVKTLELCRLKSFSFYTIVDFNKDINGSTVRVAKYEGTRPGSGLDASKMITVASVQNMTVMCDPTTLKTDAGDTIYKVTYNSTDTKGILLDAGEYIFCLYNKISNSIINTGVYKVGDGGETYSMDYWNTPGSDTIGARWKDYEQIFSTLTDNITTIDVVTDNPFDDDPIPSSDITAVWDYMSEQVVVSVIKSGIDVSSFVDHYEYAFTTSEGTITGTSDTAYIPITNTSFTGSSANYTFTVHAVSTVGGESVNASVTVSMPVSMTFSSFDTITNKISWSPTYNGEDYTSRIARYIWVCGSYSGSSVNNFIDCSSFANGTYHAVVSAVTINGNRTATSYSNDFVVDIDTHTWQYTETAENLSPAAVYTPTEDVVISGYTYYSIKSSTPASAIMAIVEGYGTSSLSIKASMKLDSLVYTNKKTSDGKYNLYQYNVSEASGNSIKLTAGTSYLFVMGQVQWGSTNYCVRNEESTLSTVMVQNWGVTNVASTLSVTSHITFKYPATTE